MGNRIADGASRERAGRVRDSRRTRLVVVLFLLSVPGAPACLAQWLPAEPLGAGPGSTFCQDIELAGDLRVHLVYYRSADEKLYERVWAGGVWEPARRIGSHTGKEPVAVTMVDRLDARRMHMVSHARGVTGTEYAIVYRGYEDGGWGAEVPLTDGASFMANPRIDQDEAGNLHAVWEGDGRGGNGDIYYRRRVNGVWEPTLNITNNHAGTSYGSSSPDVACADSGSRVAIAWHDDFLNDGFQVYFTESLAGGAPGTFGAWDLISTGSYGKAPLVDYSGADTAHVGWIHRPDGGENTFGYRKRTGGVWGGLLTPGVGPSVVWEAAPGGTIRMLYARSVGGEDDIFYAEWDGVTFSGTVNVSSDPSKSSNQALAFHGPSGWIFTGWTSITEWPDRHVQARIHAGNPIETPTPDRTPSRTPTFTLTPTATLTRTPTPSPTLTYTKRPTSTPTPGGLSAGCVQVY